MERDGQPQDQERRPTPTPTRKSQPQPFLFLLVLLLCFPSPFAWCCLPSPPVSGATFLPLLLFCLGGAAWFSSIFGCCCPFFSFSFCVVFPSIPSSGWSCFSSLLFGWVVLLGLLLLWPVLLFHLPCRWCCLPSLPLGGAAFPPVFCWVVLLGFLLLWVVLPFFLLLLRGVPFLSLLWVGLLFPCLLFCGAQGGVAFSRSYSTVVADAAQFCEEVSQDEIVKALKWITRRAKRLNVHVITVFPGKHLRGFASTHRHYHARTTDVWTPRQNELALLLALSQGYFSVSGERWRQRRGYSLEASKIQCSAVMGASETQWSEDWQQRESLGCGGRNDVADLPFDTWITPFGNSCTAVTVS